MAQLEEKGLRLLSLDGGGIRGMSTLLILRRALFQVKAEQKLASLPLPYEYFDMMAGTSTGGLIVLMLGRLRMSISDAIIEYEKLTKEVFSDVTWFGRDGKFSTSKLEKALKALVSSKAGNSETGLLDDASVHQVCKTFVCAMNSRNMDAQIPVLFRTYESREEESFGECTIWQAARATSATPAFFKRVVIGSQAYVDGGLGHNNPTLRLLDEAETTFPQARVACILSIGTGKGKTLSLPEARLVQWRAGVLPRNAVETMQRIAYGCELVHEQMARRFRKTPDVYFRFNVEQGLQKIALSQWDAVAAVEAHTLQYLALQDVRERMKGAVKILQKPVGKVSVEDLTAIQAQAPDQPQPKKCPLPTATFTGREEVLASMHDYFQEKSDRPRAYFLDGPSGSGKSQTAFKFVQECQSQVPSLFSNVFLVDATNEQTIDVDLKNMASTEKMFGDSAETTILWLAERTEPWLLVFKNATNRSSQLPTIYSQCDSGNFLITTTDQALHSGFPGSRRSKVAELAPKDATNLLLNLTVADPDASAVERRYAEDITKELRYIPLAVSQAGSFVSQGRSLAQYLEQFREHRGHFWAESRFKTLDDSEAVTFTTWKMCFDLASPRAALLLQLCSCVHSDNILEWIFPRAADSTMDLDNAEVPKALREFILDFTAGNTEWESSKFLKVTRELQSLSLLHYDPVNNSYNIHPLVYAWTRATTTDFHRGCMQGVLAMSIGWGHELHDYIFRRSIVPHVDKIIEAGLTHMVAKDRFAAVYASVDRWKDAEALQATVLQERRTALGDEHQATRTSIVNLATTYEKLGRLHDVEKLEQELLDLNRRLLGEDDPETLLSAANLVTTYQNQHKWAEAEELHAWAIEKSTKILGKEHPVTQMLADMA